MSHNNLSAPFRHLRAVRPACFQNCLCESRSRGEVMFFPSTLSIYIIGSRKPSAVFEIWTSESWMLIRPHLKQHPDSSILQEILPLHLYYFTVFASTSFRYFDIWQLTVHPLMSRAEWLVRILERNRGRLDLLTCRQRVSSYGSTINRMRESGPQILCW